MRYSVVIPVYERYEEPKALLDGLCATLRKEGLERIWLVDDGSSTDELKYLPPLFSHLKPVEYLRCEHLGPVHAINEALKRSDADIVVVISSDAEIVTRETLNGIRYSDRVSNDPIGNLVHVLQQADEFGAIAPLLLVKGVYERVLSIDITFDIDTAAQRFSGLLLFTEQLLYWPGFRLRPVQSVRGTCLAFKRELIDQLDESLHPWFRWADDLCTRVRAAGKHVILTNSSCIAHELFSEQPPGSFAELDVETVEQVNQRFRLKWANRKDLLDPDKVRPVERRLVITPQSFWLLSGSVAYGGTV